LSSPRPSLTPPILPPPIFCSYLIEALVVDDTHHPLEDAVTNEALLVDDTDHIDALFVDFDVVDFDAFEQSFNEVPTICATHDEVLPVARRSLEVDREPCGAAQESHPAVIRSPLVVLATECCSGGGSG
jgi:hypothetical protein